MPGSPDARGSDAPLKQITVQGLRAKMRDASLQAGVDFLVVDVRRTDIDELEGAYMIPGAINLPAQTFKQTLPALSIILCRIPMMIFHCSSSSGRGPRCAGWYQDFVESQSTHPVSQAVILTGGIKAWRASYPEEVISMGA